MQILGKKINANGDDGGKYGMGELLCISPDTLDRPFFNSESLWSFLPVSVGVLKCLSCWTEKNGQGLFKWRLLRDDR